MRLALFGGSFDPIHNGHLEVVKAALELLEIDKIIIMPAFLSPFKSSSKAGETERFAWVTEAFEGWDKCEVSDYEIRQKRSVPTIESVEYLKRHLHADGKIALIIGADNLAALPRWKNYDQLIQDCDIIVAARSGFAVGAGYRILPVKYDISSTDIRQGISFDKLPPKIADKIINTYKERH
jgi:nicotinate-nucleotide adenylyltransferase